MFLAKLIFYNSVKSSRSFIRSVSCWSCGQNNKQLVSELFCSQCRALQRPRQDANYFQVLGVEESFDVDEGQLARRYKELQKHLHPDKFANKPKQELEISEEYSSLVNEAYNTLLHPLDRGIYMLRLRGKDLPEQTEVDQKFLIEIMERNEEVESAQEEADIMRLREENRAQIKELQKRVSTAFFDGDMKLVIRLLGIMKYYTSIDNQIQERIRSKGIIR